MAESALSTRMKSLYGRLSVAAPPRSSTRRPLFRRTSCKKVRLPISLIELRTEITQDRNHNRRFGRGFIPLGISDSLILKIALEKT